MSNKLNAEKALIFRIIHVENVVGPDLVVISHLPEGEGADWNAVLQAQRNPTLPKPESGAVLG